MFGQAACAIPLNHAREMDEATRRTARECQRIDSDRGEYHWQPWLGKLLGKLRMSCRGGSVFLQRSDRPRRSVHRGAIVTPATDSDHPLQPSAGRRRLCRRPLRRRRAPPSARRLLRPTPTMTPTIAKQICSWQPRTPSPRTPFVLAARTRYATGSLRSSPQSSPRQGRRCGEGGDRLGEPTTDAAAPVPLAFLTPTSQPPCGAAHLAARVQPVGHITWQESYKQAESSSSSVRAMATPHGSSRELSRWHADSEGSM
jgi:hypothetical protein